MTLLSNVPLTARLLTTIRVGGFHANNPMLHDIVTIPEGTELEVSEINLDNGEVKVRAPLPLQGMAIIMAWHEIELVQEDM